MGTASGDEDSLPKVLLKVPGLHTVLLLQLLQVLAAQEECLHHDTALPSVPAMLLQILNVPPCRALVLGRFSRANASSWGRALVSAGFVNIR